ASCRAPQTDAGTGREPHRPGSWFLRDIIVFLHIFPAGVLSCRPGQGMPLLARPGAVVVFVLFQALVFLKAKQDERLLRPGVPDARRARVGVFEGLGLLFGEFDHGCLLSFMLSASSASPHDAIRSS